MFHLVELRFWNCTGAHLVRHRLHTDLVLVVSLSPRACQFEGTVSCKPRSVLIFLRAIRLRKETFKQDPAALANQHEPTTVQKARSFESRHTSNWEINAQPNGPNCFDGGLPSRGMFPSCLFNIQHLSLVKHGMLPELSKKCFWNWECFLPQRHYSRIGSLWPTPDSHLRTRTAG